MRRETTGLIFSFLLGLAFLVHASHLPAADGPKVESKLRSELAGLKENHVYTVLVVTVAPNKREQTHTHPGDEILFGLSGKGVVYVDGVKHVLEPDGVVLVRRGQKKTVSNEGGTEPLRVLACLVLEKDRPPIEFVHENEAIKAH